jgi:hypothetical protein
LVGGAATGGLRPIVDIRAFKFDARSGIKAASTFKTLADAQRHVSMAMRANRAAVNAWARTAAVGSKPFATPCQAAGVVGEGVVRATGQLQKMTRKGAILRRIRPHNRVYFVLTSCPVA